jgi:hypothetical protein
MNYIDRIASVIHKIAQGEESTPWAQCDHQSLYRIYAVLALTKREVTSEDVHDAWSAWRAETQPNHRSLVPFCDLSPEVQAYDDPYRDAINHIGGAIKGLRRLAFGEVP